MIQIVFKNKKKIKKELASEIVEILEEKLDEMNIKVPYNVRDCKEEQVKFREDLRKELVYEIADFISINKKAFSSEIAA